MGWLWWIGASLILGVVEMLTADLTFMMLAGGALAGAGAAALGVPFWIQVVVFGVVSTLLLVAVRPWAKGLLTASTPETRTNVDGLLGREATALTAVDIRGGRINLRGHEWSARLSEVDASARIEPGGTVRVVKIDGAIAVVAPVN